MNSNQILKSEHLIRAIDEFVSAIDGADVMQGDKPERAADGMTDAITKLVQAKGEIIKLLPANNEQARFASTSTVTNKDYEEGYTSERDLFHSITETDMDNLAKEAVKELQDIPGVSIDTLIDNALASTVIKKNDVRFFRGLDAVRTKYVTDRMKQLVDAKGMKKKASEIMDPLVTMMDRLANELQDSGYLKLAEKVDSCTNEILDYRNSSGGNK